MENEIFEAYEKFWIGDSYEAIENEPKNNLKWAHGNTAYRICKKYAKLGLN